MTTLEEIIREEVAARGWTMAKFGDKLGNQYPASDWVIYGERKMTPLLAARLAQVFGTSALLWERLGEMEDADVKGA